MLCRYFNLFRSLESEVHLHQPSFIMNALRVEVLTHKTSLLPSDFSLNIFLFAKYNN